MTREAVGDRALVMLYVIGGCAMGGFVAVFNIIGFRLTGEPFDLGLAAASLVYLVYPIGTVSSVLFGRLADRYGRRAVTPVACVVAVVGVLLTLVPSLVVLIVGMALLTAGFFAVHGVASGWVPERAHAAGVSTGQAASLYLLVLPRLVDLRQRRRLGLACRRVVRRGRLWRCSFSRLPRRCRCGCAAYPRCSPPPPTDAACVENQDGGPCVWITVAWPITWADRARGGRGFRLGKTDGR